MIKFLIYAAIVLVFLFVLTLIGSAMLWVIFSSWPTALLIFVVSFMVCSPFVFPIVFSGVSTLARERVCPYRHTQQQNCQD